jgi:hypothetical protein
MLAANIASDLLAVTTSASERTHGPTDTAGKQAREARPPIRRGHDDTADHQTQAIENKPLGVGISTTPARTYIATPGRLALEIPDGVRPFERQ